MRVSNALLSCKGGSGAGRQVTLELESLVFTVRDLDCDFLLRSLPVSPSADMLPGDHTGLAGSFLSGALLGAAQGGEWRLVPTEALSTFCMVMRGWGGAQPSHSSGRQPGAGLGAGEPLSPALRLAV